MRAAAAATAEPTPWCVAVVTAKTVQGMYDYAAEKPVPIPDEVRALLKVHGKKCDP